MILLFHLLFLYGCDVCSCLFKSFLYTSDSSIIIELTFLIPDMSSTLPIGGYIVIGMRTEQFDNDHDKVNTKQATEELVAAKKCSFEKEEVEYFPHNPGYNLIYTVL